MIKTKLRSHIVKIKQQILCSSVRTSSVKVIHFTSDDILKTIKNLDPSKAHAHDKYSDDKKFVMLLFANLWN